MERPFASGEQEEERTRLTTTGTTGESSPPAISLNEKRAEREHDSRKWTPLDMARALLRDIEGGEINPKYIAVHYLEEEDDHRLRHGYYAAGVTFFDHISLLNVALRRTLDSWMGKE